MAFFAPDASIGIHFYFIKDEFSVEQRIGGYLA